MAWTLAGLAGPVRAVDWQPAQPADQIEKGPWWQVFADADLDRLQIQARQNNPTVAVVAARLSQAQAQTRLAGAALLPHVDASLRSSRSESSANRPVAAPGSKAVSSTQNDHLLSLSVAYEADLFGRLHGEQAVARAGEEQARADLANAQLVLSADLAAAYFSLRQLESELAVVRRGLGLQARALDLLNTRHEGGATSGLDVAQQQALIDANQTQLALLQRQRDAQWHALATLVGEPPARFNLTQSGAGTQSQPVTSSLPALPELPALPSELSSTLLQRRPDVAAAERAVAAANAQLGVSRAGYFPSLTLALSGGWESRDIDRLISGPSLLWSLGAQLLQTVFDGGRNDARVQSAQAALEASSAQYRQTVLRALQEVADGSSNLADLSLAATQAERAVSSARKVLDVAQTRYSGGLVSYLDVVTAEQNLLNNQRLAVQIRGQQLVATAYMAKALGGNWLVGQLGP